MPGESGYDEFMPKYTDQLLKHNGLLLLACVLLCALPVAVFSQQPVAKPQRLTTDGKDKQRPAWSPDGKTLVFARHEPTGTFGASIFLYLLDPQSPNDIKRMTDRELPEYHATFASGGSPILLVTVSQSGTQGNLDIARLDLPAGKPEKVIGDPNGKLSHQDWPAWAPDGKQFAFSSTHDGNQEIYSCDLQGEHLTRLTQSPGQDAHPCYTPDGKRIIFSTDRWAGLELASMELDGTDLIRLTLSPALDDFPAVSPDGKRIAFVSNRDGNYEVYVCNLDGSNPVNLTNHLARDTQPTWTPDGTGITFISDRQGGTDLYTIQID